MIVFLQNARLSFPDLWEPSAIQGGKPKFGGDFILQDDTQVLVVKEDGKKVKGTLDKVMEAVAKDQWKDKGMKVLDGLEASKKCYRDGDLKTNAAEEVYEGYEGRMYITAKNATRPTILDRNKSPLTESDGRPYSGCYVNAKIDVYAMPKGEKKGIFASLLGLQFVKDGDSFSGGAVASVDDFDEVEEEAGEDDDMFN